MSAQQSNDVSGPSWNDLRAYMEECRSTWEGGIYIEVTLAPRNPRRTSYGLWVRVVWRGRPGGGACPEMATGQFWPSSEHRTMPAMCFRLLHELEQKLGDRAHDIAMQEAHQGLPQQVSIDDYIAPYRPKTGA